MHSPVTLSAILMFAATLLQFPVRARSAKAARAAEHERNFDIQRFLEDSPTPQSSAASDITALFFS